MPTALRSDTPRRTFKPLVSQSGPTEVQFKHFGTLKPAQRSGIGPVTSIIGNVTLAFCAWALWKATPPVQPPRTVETLTFAQVEPPPPPPPPKLPPTPRMKPPVVEPTPKVTLPEVKLPDPPKAMPAPVATPAVKPAPPKVQEAPPAPKIMPAMLPKAAAVVNNDKVPTPVKVGLLTNPIEQSNRPPVAAAVDLGHRGAPGMNEANNGHGPISQVNLGGSGNPNGGNLNGNGRTNVQGVRLGDPKGYGNPGGNGQGTAPPALIALGRPPQPAGDTRPSVQPLSKGKAPQVLYQPKPVYTADATANHVEGTIRVKIRVAATGQVTVLGMVGGGLGHGLDQSALNAAQAIRFRPALDATGNPTDWEGVVSVQFQIAT
jgi:TonB family protein